MFNQRTSIKSFNPYDFLDRNRERKVVFYGRVSTEHEAQISALGNQIQWYDEQAKNHSNWTIIDKYIDEGITGTQAKKRPAFLKMIDDAKEKRFDLIVTREVCRFARNTVDTLVTTRELKNIGIEVYFVEDNIWTMDGDGELRLSLMATLAQEESRKVSERVKAGQQISREKATLYGSGNILGYDRCGKSYVINEEQAETVRLIYNMYMNDGIGTMKIANKLIEMHKLNASGVVKWTAATINRILNNKTYAGYVVYGKSYSNNYLEQRRVNNYDTSTYMYAKGDFEPIISEEVWNKCQEIKKNRVTSCFGTTVNGKPKNHGKIESKDVWVKKLKCSCGASFRKNRWHKNKNCDWSYGYQCYNQLNNGSAKQRRLAGEDDEGYCDQRMIADWKLELMAKMVFEEVWKNHTDCISETIKIIKRCYRENKVENNQKNSIMFQIEKIKSKKNILLDMRTSGEITKDEFLEQKEVLNKKLSLLESELKNCFEIDTKQIQIDYDEILKSLNEIVDFSNPKMDRELLQRFIAKVVPNGENHFIWYLNLDGKSDTRLNVNIVGNKKNAIVSIDESGDISPLHTSDILYFNDEKSFTVETLHMLRLAFCTVLSDIPASAAAFTMSSLASSFPSANRSSISLSACSVLVAVLPPAPDSSSSAVMSYSPIHEKPVSGSRQKATGLPSGAREDLSWTITRTFGSRFTRPISRTLLAAARKSIEPNPRYALCPPAALLRCPIRITAHPVRSATSARRRNMGRTSFARFMSVFSPMYACMGSRIISRAPFCAIAFSMRSSDRVSSRLASSITSTRSRSAAASIKRGLTVSPSPSSAVW